MGIEGRIAELRALEVGNVERVIGDVEIIKSQTERTSESLDQELRKYKHLVEDKLPRIIDNIQTIAPMIFELGLVPKYNIFGENFNADISLNANEKPGSLTFGLEYRGYGKEDGFFRFEIIFNNRQVIEDLSLPSFATPKEEGIWPFKKIEKPYYLIAKTTQDFAERYSRWATFSLQETGQFNFIKLPHLLNRVPYFIKEMYKDRKVAQEAKLTRVSSHNESISALDVSDFK